MSRPDRGITRAWGRVRPHARRYRGSRYMPGPGVVGDAAPAAPAKLSRRGQVLI
jgi:hypothetical protein